MALYFRDATFLDQLILLSQGALRETFTAPAPESLYHYTTPENVQKISVSRELWAKCLNAQNDSTELTHGINLVEWEAFKLLDNENNLFFHRILRDLPEQMRSRKKWVFISCFCGIQQSKLHLNAYGSSCLRFDFPKDWKPQLECHDNKAYSWYSPVIYSEREQLQSVRTFLQNLREIVLQNLQGRPEDDKAEWLHQGVTRDAANCLLLLAACFKREKYEAEREWRLLFMPNFAPGSSAPSMSDEAFAPAIKLEPFRLIALRRKNPTGGPFGMRILDRTVLPFDEIIA